MKRIIFLALFVTIGTLCFASGNPAIDAKTALARLKAGNTKFINAKKGSGDISLSRRKETAEKGQFPYATVITCSDSRAIPENIFSCGIGDIFTIRVAGNVIAPQQLGSIEYAAEHLGTKLVVVLGHSKCGAVGAAMESVPEEGYIHFLTDNIKTAIGQEKDYAKAIELNTRAVVSEIKTVFKDSVTVVGAIYNIETGTITWLDE